MLPGLDEDGRSLRKHPGFTAPPRRLAARLAAGLLALFLALPIAAKRAAAGSDDDRNRWQWEGKELLRFERSGGRREQLLVLHTSLGGASRWTLSPREHETRSGTFEAEVGVRWLFGTRSEATRIGLAFDLGGTYNDHPTLGGGLFAAGAGLYVSLLSCHLNFRLATAGVVGYAPGVRSGLRLEIFLTILHVGVEHQVLYPRGGPAHSVGLVIGLDVMQLIGLIHSFTHYWGR